MGKRGDERRGFEVAERQREGTRPARIMGSMGTKARHRSRGASGGPPRVFLIGDVGGESTFHLGDEAMLQANLERLRAACPEAELTVASHDPAWTARRYAVRAVPRPNLAPVLGAGEPNGEVLERLISEALDPPAGDGDAPHLPIPAETARALAEADALLISGGGNLNASWPEQLYERVLLLGMAQRLDVTAVVTGQTLGPHLQPSQREALRRALFRLPFVGVRETYSRVVGHLLGVAAEHLVYHLDDAFFAPRLGSPGGTSGLGREQRWIAVTVTRLPGPLEPLAQQLGSIARETGCRLVFVPHAKASDGDEEVAGALVGLLSGGVEAEVLTVPSPEVGRRITEGAAMVLSMRYHPLVFAVAGGVPALGLYVDDYTRVKLRGALGHGGVDSWVMPIQMALAGGLAEAGLDLWRQREAIRRHLAAQTARWQTMERRYRNRLVRALGIDSSGEAQAEDAVPLEAPPLLDSGTSAAPGPSAAWSQVSRLIEERSDLWFMERVQLLEQVDTAVEYALSLEETLVHRDREIGGLKRLLQRPGPVAT